MAVVDQVEVWKARLKKVEEKIEAGEKRLAQMEVTASTLIGEGAETAKVSRAKADYQAAEIDLAHLRRALDAAKLELNAAKDEQAVDVIKQKGDKVSRLQKRRAKLLKAAEGDFHEALEKLASAEALALEIHAAGAGCASLGEAINNRHGPICTWLVLRLLDIMPIAEVHIGAAIANHNAARQQMGEKALIDLQPDYAEMFKRFHSKKDKAA